MWGCFSSKDRERKQGGRKEEEVQGMLRAARTPCNHLTQGLRVLVTVLQRDWSLDWTSLPCGP